MLAWYLQSSCVCLSVHLSVTSQCSTKAAKPRIKKQCHTISQGLVFRCTYLAFLVKQVLQKQIFGIFEEHTLTDQPKSTEDMHTLVKNLHIIYYCSY